MVSPVTEAITEAVTRSGGRALGGAATFIPLLERFGTETTLQARPAGPLFWSLCVCQPCSPSPFINSTRAAEQQHAVSMFFSYFVMIQVDSQGEVTHMGSSALS